MLHWKSFSRVFLFLTLQISLLAGVSAPAFVTESVSAAPKSAVSVGDVVISEFRFLGPAGGDDEFIELYNPKNIPVNITGLKIMGSNNSAGTGQRALLGSVTLQAGQHYLLVNSAASAGLKALNDATYPTGLTEDGGIALMDGSTTIDAVGLSSGSAYKEGTPLTPLAGTAEQSYERRDNGCTDTDNNSTDFVWNQTSSNPQNSLVIPVSCVRVINVTSPMSDVNPFKTGDIITITVQFSTNVNVTGSPTLLLETGATHRNATYLSGSGSDTLTFNYTVIDGDVTGDLDYVGINSLSLNGGTIIGAVGNANLTLPIQSVTCPSPATPCSLGANKNIIIDNQAPPTVTINQANGQADPTGITPINFTVVFSEPINVSTFIPVDDITQTGAATVTAWNITDLGDHTNFTLSATAIIGVGTITPSIAIGKVSDSLGNLNTAASTSIDNVITFENTRPTVTVDRALGQPASTGNTPINFTVIFSKPIDVTTFTVSDITASGSGITWVIKDSGDHKTFTLSAIAVASAGITTLTPSINADQVKDLAGNGNQISTNTSVGSGTVAFDNSRSPSVTINQASTQLADPTAIFPIKFTVVFSEAIIASIFTPSDITQNGTATGITWSIADSGDHTNFTLSATAGTCLLLIPCTLTPSIAANRVTDLVGNNNTASNTPPFNGDDTVSYENISPTVKIIKALGQVTPTSTLPINFTVTFSEPITPSTFTKDDITQLGTATGVLWNAIIDSGDHKVFKLSAANMTTNGTVKPYIPANLVQDVAGNNNFASTSADSVTYTGTLPTPTRAFTPTPTAMPTLDLLINEVAWMGTKASTADEWIELYNNTTGTVDLTTGWKLSITNSTTGTNVIINLSGTIPSGGYLVIESNSSVFNDLNPATPRMIVDFSLSNSGEIMKLLHPDGHTVDTANHDSGGWPAGVSSTFSSMERYGKTNETPDTWATFDSSNFVVAHDKIGNAIRGTPGQANWATTVILTPRPTSTPTRKVTPFRTPTPVPPRLSGRPIISEFLARPGFDWNQDGKVDVFDEFIEVKNAGPVDISLSGWKLDDEANLGSAIFTLPAVTLKPGERAVFYGLATNILLGDGGDSVRLLNPSGQVYDSYTYAVAKVEDQSTCRLPDVSGNEFGFGEWFTDCVPTPNLTNTRQGTAPSMPGGEAFEPTTCDLPDTLPADFLFAECRGYGTNIWNTFYWDQPGWQGEQYVPENMSKWESFVK